MTKNKNNIYCTELYKMKKIKQKYILRKLLNFQ